jgi:hypothetical protein
MLREAHKRISPGLGRQLHVQSVPTLVELELGFTAQQDNGSHMFTSHGLCKGTNYGFSVRRPTESNGVEHIALRRKSEVLRCVARCLDVVKRSRCNFRGSLAIDSPWSSAVDGISIHVQPGSDIQKNLLYFVRYGPVGSGTDIHEQVAILADDVNELMD